MQELKICLTIAGSDSGGGAGIQADIKSIQANGVFAASVLTAVTAQNTAEVTDAMDLPPSLIRSQFDAVVSDMQVASVKTGMLSSVEIIECVSDCLQSAEVGPCVVDPVMISKSGFPLLQADAVDALRKNMLPRADIVTPNAHEATLLASMDVKNESDAHEAARKIFDMGPRAVLIKGGHLDEEEDALDILFDGDGFLVLRTERIETQHTHGTGCTYAAAIASNLAKGFSLRTSVERSRRYVTEAIRGGLPIGKGHGPTDHFYYLRGLADFPYGR